MVEERGRSELLLDQYVEYRDHKYGLSATDRDSAQKNDSIVIIPYG